MSYEKPLGSSGAETAAVFGRIAKQQHLKAVQTLIGICSGIVADGVVHEREVMFLRTWLSENPDTCKEWPGSIIARRLKAMLADGVITANERELLLDDLQQISGTYFTETGSAQTYGPLLPIDDDPCLFFQGMTYCFTGKFLFGTRASCERAVLKLGATAVDAVTKNLNYLVIGSMIEPQWANTTYGRKIEKAVTYRDSGCDITIVCEEQWIAALADNG